MGTVVSVAMMAVGIVVALCALAWHFRAPLVRFLAKYATSTPPGPPKT
jgi:hypothetical protein